VVLEDQDQLRAMVVQGVVVLALALLQQEEPVLAHKVKAVAMEAQVMLQIRQPAAGVVILQQVKME
jgi:hypothetical protein